MFRFTTLILAATLLLMPHIARAQLIVAHRGASHDAPENTLAAFKLAWKQGADAAEGDFHLTKDGRIICSHDADTKRCAGVDKKIVATEFDELRKLDVGSWKDKKYSSERMPTLLEVLATVPKGKLFLIEVKCGPEIVPALKADIARSKVQPDQLVIISFKDSVIAAARQEMPQIKAHWLVSYKQDKETKAWSPTRDQVLDTLKKCNASGLDTHAHETIDTGFVKRLRDTKLEFHCWTVDDPKVARRFIGLGVDSITTNRPAWLREQLGDALKQSPNATSTDSGKIPGGIGGVRSKSGAN